jgi:hypothetical protein
MDVTTLILTLTGLLGVLLVLVLIYIFTRGPKEPAKAAVKTETAPRRAPEGLRTLEALEAVIRDRSSSKEELSSAVEAIGSHYGKIHATTLARYSRIIMSLCRHPNTDKTIIIGFDKVLRQQNPGMRQELDLALRKGLDSRG